MELVYLWVEEYKNIHRQGFNFSSRFECDYDEDNNELTIDENNDYIENFFGDKINVTAIVGKNGSGKSSLLKLIQEIDGESLKIYEMTSKDVDIQKLIKKGYSDKITTDSSYSKLKHYIFFFRENDNDLLTLYTDITDIRVDNKKINRSSNKLSMNFNYLHSDHTFNDDDLNDDITLNLRSFDIDNILLNGFKNSPKSLPIKVSSIMFKLKDDSYIDNIDDETYFNTHKNNKLETKLCDIEFLIKNKKNLIIHYYFQEKKIEIGDLSYGEKILFLIFGKINDIIDTPSNLKYNYFIFCLDEMELGLHPEWQKKYIDYIVKFFHKQYPKKTIQFIFTTHSPFLLSDLPKENVIFLDKVDDEAKEKYPKSITKDLEDGDCINVSKHIDINPFGANIHTLLSDGFFMENGLMGEFAKGKINEIIEFHKEVKKENKKEISNLIPLKTEYEEKCKIKFWQTQSIIGEDYLKQVIKNHLRDIENILLGNDEAKNEEIKRLRLEADRLESMS